MSKYYSIPIKIISAVTLFAFISTQAAWGYEGQSMSKQPQKSHLRLQQPDRSEAGPALASALEGQFKQAEYVNPATAGATGGNANGASFEIRDVFELIANDFGNFEHLSKLVMGFCNDPRQYYKIFHPDVLASSSNLSPTIKEAAESLIKFIFLVFAKDHHKDNINAGTQKTVVEDLYQKLTAAGYRVHLTQVKGAQPDLSTGKSQSHSYAYSSAYQQDTYWWGGPSWEDIMHMWGRCKRCEEIRRNMVEIIDDDQEAPPESFANATGDFIDTFIREIGQPQGYSLPEDVSLQEGDVLEPIKAINSKGEIVVLGKRKIVRELGSGLASVVYLVEDEYGNQFVEKYFGKIKRKSGLAKFLIDMFYSLVRKAPFAYRHNPHAVLAAHITNSLVNDLHVIKEGRPLTPYILYTRFDERTSSYVQAFDYVQGRKVKLSRPDYQLIQNWIFNWIIRPLIYLPALLFFGKKIQPHSGIPFWGEISEALYTLSEYRHFLADELGFWGLARQTDPLNLNSPGNLLIDDKNAGEKILVDIIPGMPGGLFFFLPLEIGYFIRGLKASQPFPFADAMDFDKLEKYIEGLKTSGQIDEDSSLAFIQRVKLLKEVISLWKKSEQDSRKGYMQWLIKKELPRIAKKFVQAFLSFIIKLPKRIYNSIINGIIHIFKIIFNQEYRHAKTVEWIENILKDTEARGAIDDEEAVAIRQDLSNIDLIKTLSLYVLYIFAHIFKPLPPIVGMVANISLIIAFFHTLNPVYLFLLFMDGIIRAVITAVVMWFHFEPGGKIKFAGFRGMYAVLVSAIPTLGYVCGPAVQIQNDYPHVSALILRHYFWKVGSAVPGIDDVSLRAMFYEKLSDLVLSFNQMLLDVINFINPFKRKNNKVAAFEGVLAVDDSREAAVIGTLSVPVDEKNSAKATGVKADLNTVSITQTEHIASANGQPVQAFAVVENQPEEAKSAGLAKRQLSRQESIDRDLAIANAFGAAQAVMVKISKEEIARWVKEQGLFALVIDERDFERSLWQEKLEREWGFEGTVLTAATVQEAIAMGYFSQENLIFIINNNPNEQFEVVNNAAGIKIFMQLNSVDPDHDEKLREFLESV